MPNFGTPVADQVQGPSAGIQTLSNLMGLKQKQLDIQKTQIGLSQAQQLLKSETAEATVRNIQASQQQALRGIDWKQFVNSDGSYNIDAATSAALQAAPNIGPEFVTRLGQMAQQGALTKKAFPLLSQRLLEP